MDYNQLIIDGYNLLCQDGPFDSQRYGLETARQGLVRQIERLALGMADQLTVVFDGRKAGRDLALSSSHLEVIFSPSNRTADGVIEQLVHNAKDPARILVVTSDRMEQQLVSVFGASVISCREFLLRCEAVERVASSKFFGKRLGPTPTFGDFFED